MNRRNFITLFSVTTVVRELQRSVHEIRLGLREVRPLGGAPDAFRSFFGCAQK